ncbi:MAG: transcriptional regulator NrdR [Patescibacteria group bacterium]
MNCPFCKSDQLTVLDSRDTEGGEAIRRRRECLECQRRFTTYERVEDINIKVIKKNGEKEQFDREKIKRGLIKATWKRPVSMEQIGELISDVERKLRLRDTREVKSWEIGNLVINRLKKIDKLSYLLFASVYRDFASLEDFKTEIEKIQQIEDGEK